MYNLNVPNSFQNRIVGMTKLSGNENWRSIKIDFDTTRKREILILLKVLFPDLGKSGVVFQKQWFFFLP